MSEENMDVNPYFVEIVFQLQGAAWIHMGKIANPATGNVERNLEMARGAIDMLGMLEEKTRGNLTEEEDKLLRELLNQVRLNYVSEQDKPDSAPEASADAAASDASATGDAPSPESNEASTDEKTT